MYFRYLVVLSNFCGNFPINYYNAEDATDAEEEMLLEKLSHKILDAAIKVHSTIGPGLFEEVYKVCLRHELLKSGLNVLSEVGLPVIYDSCQLEVGYRVDLLVEDSIILELKSVHTLAPIHRAQMLNYLKLAKKEVGLLLNFNTPST